MKQNITSELQRIIHNNKMKRRNQLIIRWLWVFVGVSLITMCILLHSIRGVNIVAFYTLCVPFVLIKAYGAQLLISDIGVITDYDIALRQQNN